MIGGSEHEVQDQEGLWSLLVLFVRSVSRPEHPRRSERHSYSLYHAQLDRGLFVSYTFAFISVVSRRMDEVVQSDMSLLRDPGFGSARTVFLAQVMEGDWVAKRIRIVGKW